MTSRFPKEELYGLTSQLRRAAYSVPTNIAEGFRKPSQLDKVRFYNIAQGSLEECVYGLILARDLNYADTQPLRTQFDEVARMLESYISSILNSSSQS